MAIPVFREKLLGEFGEVQPLPPEGAKVCEINLHLQLANRTSSKMKFYSPAVETQSSRSMIISNDNPTSTLKTFYDLIVAF